jgi:hypothetical protein
MCLVAMLTGQMESVVSPGPLKWYQLLIRHPLPKAGGGSSKSARLPNNLLTSQPLGRLSLAARVIDDDEACVNRDEGAQVFILISQKARSSLCV